MSRIFYRALFSMKAFEMLLTCLTVLSLSLYYKLISVALPLWIIYFWVQTGRSVTFGDLGNELKKPISIALLLLVFWAGMTSLGSDHPMRGLRIDGQILLILIYIMFFSIMQKKLNTSQRAKVRSLWTVIYLDALYVIAVETLLQGKIGNVIDRLFTSSHTNDYFMIKPSITLVAFLSIPLLYRWAREKKYIQCAASWFLLMALSSANSNETALILLIVVPFVFLGIYSLGRYFFILAKVGLIGSIAICTVFSSYFITVERLIKLASPFVREGKMNSLFQRFDMWEFATTLARKTPLKGLGMGSSKYAPGGDVTTEHGGASIQLHPHNNIIQVWLELGYVGLILWGAVIYLIINLIQKLPATRIEKAMYATLFVAVFTTSNVSYSAWHTFWLSSLVMLWIVCSFYTSNSAEQK